MRIRSLLERVWMCYQSRLGVSPSPLGLVWLLLILSNVSFAASVADTNHSALSGVSPQWISQHTVDLSYSAASQKTWGKNPNVDLVVLDLPAGQYFSVPVLDRWNPSLFEDPSESEGPPHLAALVCVVLLAGGIVLYLRSPTFHDWLNQLIYDVVSPLKYE